MTNTESPLGQRHRPRRSRFNPRLVVFAALMTALLGALFGWGSSSIGQPDLNRLRFESPFYVWLHAHRPMIGAVLGAALGAGFATISQSARLQESERRRHLPRPRIPR
jgi:hypothetical protein